MSGDGFRRRPIFAAGFRGAGHALAWPGPARVWSVWQELNLRPSGPKPDALPGCATHGRKTNNACRASISVVSSRDGPRAGRGPVERRCTGVINSCTSRQTVDAAISGGGVKAHPKWKAAKTKRPGTLRCPGLFARELERCAPTRDLHPGAPDEPRTDHPRADGLRLWRRTRCSGAKTTTGATACRNHGRTRRARAVGPRRVECW